jgi:hypothetical protein
VTRRTAAFDIGGFFYLRPRYVLSRLGRRHYGSLLRQGRLLVSQAVS